MADKDITIGLKTAGGDQAAGEVGKLTTAVDQANESFGEGSTAASEMEENVSKISRVQQAQAVSQLASHVGKIGESFRKVADDVEGFDKELAATLRNAGQGLETVASGLSTVAMGFAVGGPLGAAAGALTVVISEVGKAWIESETASAKALQAQTLALQKQFDAARETKQEIEARNEEISNAEVLTAINNATEAAREHTTELQRQVSLLREKRQLESEVLDAQDRTDLAQVDLDQELGNLTGPEAAEKRASIEAAARKRVRDERKRQAEEDAAIAKKQAQEDFKAAQETARQANDLFMKKEEAKSSASDLEAYLSQEKTKMPMDEDGKLNPEDQRFLDRINDELEHAKEMLAKLEAASSKAEAAVPDAFKKAATSQRGATETADRARQIAETVDTVQSEDDKRQSTIRQTRTEEQKRKSEQEADRKAKEAVREQERQEVERLRAQSQVGRDAVSMIPKDASNKARAAVEAAAAKLQDGDQGGEMDRILSLVESMARYIEKTQGKDSAKAIKIAQLEARIKNLK